MIYGEPVKKIYVFFNRLHTSDVIHLMDKKPSIFHQHARCQFYLLLGMPFHLKAVLWYTDICVVPQIQSPSGLAGIQND